jgi:hypothetical protein
MKYISCFALTLLAFSSQAQQKELSAPGIVKTIQGQWVSEEDSTFSIRVMHDTMVENRAGDQKLFEYTVKKESCDPAADTKLAKKAQSTGYYINESTEYDGVEFCNVVVAISDSAMTWYTTDGMIDLKRKK